MNAMVTWNGIADMQVCVPKDWSDDEVKAFADANNPSGLPQGWRIRTDPGILDGCPERNPCDDHDGYVHVMLDC